jgi:1-acyl-sn-glycerol-3-phosphate acyltransferase
LLFEKSIGEFKLQHEKNKIVNFPLAGKFVQNEFNFMIDNLYKMKKNFVSKDEFENSLNHIFELKNEVKRLALLLEASIESKLNLNQGEMFGQFQRSLRQQEKPGNKNIFEIFRLRKKYHESSLKLRSEEVDAFGFDPIFNDFIFPLFDFLYTKYFRVDTYGMAHVPSKKPVLFVGNHSGSLPYDATMLKVALEKEHPQKLKLRFMVEDFLFHFPFLGSLMNRFGGVRACQDNAQSLLQSKNPVLVFPEGVKGLGKLYADKYKLARFGRGGFIKLCLRTKSQILPVAFIGPEEIHPMIYKETFLAHIFGIPYLPVTPTFPWLGPVGLVPLPTKWTIHILPPVDFSQYDASAEKDRVLVYKLAKQVKEVIQDTISDQVKRRRSVWFG